MIRQQLGYVQRVIGKIVTMKGKPKKGSSSPSLCVIVCKQTNDLYRVSVDCIGSDV